MCKFTVGWKQQTVTNINKKSITIKMRRTKGGKPIWFAISEQLIGCGVATAVNIGPTSCCFGF